MSANTVFVTDLTFSEADIAKANTPINEEKQCVFPAKNSESGEKYFVTFIKDGLPENTKIWAYLTSLMNIDFISLLPIVGFSHPETSNFTYPAIFQKNQGIPTLLDILQKGEVKFTPEQKRSIAVSTASAIRFLHNSKIVHNNLYLDNVLVTPEGTSFVSGYGIPYSQNTVTTIRPEFWNPPEQAPSNEGDIFDLGLIFKAIFTEKVPTDISIPEDAPEALKAILEGCFTEIKGNRITEDSLITALFSENEIFGPKDYANRDKLTPFAAKQININVYAVPSKVRFFQLCKFAESGNAAAMNKVGLQFEKGIDCDRDDAQSLNFFNMAADKGSIEALCNLGRIYFEGNNRFAPQSIPNAISFYDCAGAHGEMNRDNKEMVEKAGNALLRAAEIMNTNAALDDINDSAIQFYERAASLGNTEAALKVGRFLFKHINDMAQRQRTGDFLRRAAEAGSAPAQNEYARYLEKILKDEDDALRFYMLAADQGHELALFNAGRILMKKKGDTDAISRGIEYMRLAAEKNNSLAMLKLGQLLLSGKLVERNAEEGFQLIKSSVELKNALALNDLGECYLYGNGCQQNITEARRYFEQAANCRIPRGCTNYGHMLIQEGPMRYKEAFAVYRLAAEMNDPIGMICCGQLLESGFGGAEEPRYAQASSYYQRAAALGNSYAYSNLGRMYQNGKGVTQDSKLAVKMFRRAIELGNTNAMFNLGAMYENGAGVPQSQADANKYYFMAAEQGNPQALYKCATILEKTEETADRIRAAKMRRFAEIKMRLFSLLPDNISIEEAMGPFTE